MTARLVVAAVLLSTLAACGSSSRSSAAGVGTAFGARAKAVCRSALESKRAWSPFPVANFDPAHPDPSGLPKAAAWLDEEVSPTFEAWLRQLRALGDPPQAQEEWSAVVAAVARVVRGNADEIAAAQAGDVARFGAAHDRLEATQTELERATAAAGVPSCADVHK